MMHETNFLGLDSLESTSGFLDDTSCRVLALVIMKRLRICDRGTSIFTMFWTILFIFLYSASTVLGQEKEQYRMGLLLPAYHPGMRHWPYFTQMVQPGIDIALEEVEQTILPNHNITYLPLDTMCLNQMSMVLSVHMKYTYECDIFLGPACEYAVAPTARFCDYWEVPLITAGALAQGFSKEYFDSITRMQGSYDKFALSLVQFFQLQDWNTTMLLVDEPIRGEIKDCFFCMGGVDWTFGDYGISTEVEGFDELELTHDHVRKLLEKVQPVARNIEQVVSIESENDTNVKDERDLYRKQRKQR